MTIPARAIVAKDDTSPVPAGVPESELLALRMAAEMIGEDAVTEKEMMIARLLIDLLLRLEGAVRQ